MQCAEQQALCCCDSSSLCLFIGFLLVQALVKAVGRLFVVLVNFNDRCDRSQWLCSRFFLISVLFHELL